MAAPPPAKPIGARWGMQRDESVLMKTILDPVAHKEAKLAQLHELMRARVTQGMPPLAPPSPRVNFTHPPPNCNRTVSGWYSQRLTRFPASVPADNCPLPKEAQPLVSSSDIRLIQHFDSALGLVRRYLFMVLPHPLLTLPRR